MGALLLDLGIYILDLLAQPFFLMVVFIVGLQYYRVLSLHKKFHGTSRLHLGYLFGALLMGIFAGYVGSLLLILLGISIELTGPMYLWVVSLILFLFNQRLLCFAYSGGVIALCHLLTGFPSISVPQVLGLVGTLHLVEAGLIYLSGHWDPLPIYFRRADGKLVGGFVLQKFWPLPLVALANVYLTSAGGGLTILPHWWPLLIPKQFGGMLLALTAIPAALGYGDVASSSTPEVRAKKSALNLAVYSLVLLSLTYLSALNQEFVYVAVLFAPLGHELVIYLGKRQEFQATPIFQQEQQGVKILEVLSDTPAFSAGLRRGDIILKLNETHVYTRNQLSQAVKQAGNTYRCTFLSQHNGTVQIRKLYSAKQLGIITVPEEQDKIYVEVSGTGPLLSGLTRLVAKIRF
ncbi:MAG TPA: PDZ domain-containing protein [Candidatus Deferrimicrobium sp.]|nr:PDZ domain-containing protein [Candidatus Deferrimicrobium sp.]